MDHTSHDPQEPVYTAIDPRGCYALFTDPTARDNYAVRTHSCRGPDMTRDRAEAPVRETAPPDDGHGF